MKNNEDKSLSTILVWVLFLGVLYWIYRSPGWLLAAGIVGLIGLFIPSLAAKLHMIWMALAKFMGRITGGILLTVIYLAILTPLAFLSRLMGKRYLSLKSGDSAFTAINAKTYDRRSLENSW